MEMTGLLGRGNYRGSAARVDELPLTFPAWKRGAAVSMTTVSRGSYYVTLPKTHGFERWIAKIQGEQIPLLQALRGTSLNLKSRKA